MNTGNTTRDLPPTGFISILHHLLRQIHKHTDLSISELTEGQEFSEHVISLQVRATSNIYIYINIKIKYKVVVSFLYLIEFTIYINYNPSVFKY